jgi:hypothetical protein
MRWQHTHSWAVGILTGIIIDQRSVYLIAFGAVIAIVFMKIGATFRAYRNRRWTIRS